MFYFLRLVGFFLVVFIGLALIIQSYIVPAPQQDDTVMPSALTMVIPQTLIRVNNTQTGLLLAGRVAQDDRNWGEARKNFTALIDQYGGDAAAYLKAMTLSLGAGDMQQAEQLAKEIDTKFLSSDDFEADAETFDLARLFLVAEAIKNKNDKAAQQYIDELHRGALSQLVKPIVQNIINSDNAESQFDAKIQGLNTLQIVYKALAAELHKDMDVAVTLFDEISKRQITPQTSEMIAAFYMRQGEKLKAFKVIDKALRQFPDDKALNETHKILSETPDSYKAPSYASYHLESPAALLSIAFHDFARVMVAEQAMDSALLFARMASYADENSPGVWMSIGDILGAQGQQDEALEAYLKVDANDADYVAAQMEIVDVLRDRNQIEDAIDRIEELVEDDQHQQADLYLTLGNLYKWDDQHTKAIEAYDHAETLALADNNGVAPDWIWPLYYFRGVSFDQLGRYPEAEKDLLKALEFRPDSAMVLNYLGYSYADDGLHLDKAREMIAKAVEQSPDDAYIVDSMGWVLFRMGNYDEAVQYLERAAQMKPYHAVINDHLGDAYWKVGRKLEAYYMWQRAVDYKALDDVAEGEMSIDDEEAEAARNAAEKLKTGLVESN